MSELFNSLKNGLVVSCQSEGDDPFNTPEGVTLFAKAAVMGGAAGIRSQGIDKSTMIKNSVDVPVIGLLKSTFPDGTVRITGSFKEVEKLTIINMDIIAVDGTFRLREGLTGPEFISAIKERFDCVIMADISTVDEALACSNAGADCISSTLSGYTPETAHKPKLIPDYELVEILAGKVDKPVFAEGKIITPEAASEMIKRGAWGVVVGTAITRPRVITQWYINAMKESLEL
ncbi:MAG: N-acetylmannosamine-6-phosphate 2-epimerase [Ignavibacteriales bacterium]|jgi:N-acylglucosamine-6-phosphate 2-epimerase|nr:N-acetylmannosamine-6-phosphate 2-epimerase [Ignavibacteriaceae bacterium]NLH61798.1 N-acetylmannosamine-6-phosphate 2-epimerase [Ignavibacteriales bacterium]HOJ18177.1 N-acetylmannosamine-6-phosphate 2-epimerase [Ignavibacteriaceae bacterium]HPO55730.1 N-acetylmannosamine-6-phosphate 2-epimerase [Ignavibacteriaceae bacterium]